MRRLRARLASEDGMTLIELLVASAMSVILVGAAGSMVISAVRDQPRISKQSQNVSEARWVLERFTREIRNGIRVDVATSSQVSFLARVRRTSCGGPVPTDPDADSIRCEVTYACTTNGCTRSEAEDGQYDGTPQTLFTSSNDPNVFCYVPSTDPEDPLECGSAASLAGTTFIGVKLRIPNPTGPGALAITDGANLRTASLVQ
jgi:prepilin-type N-terminal cleavage/methylation domain-containing protein